MDASSVRIDASMIPQFKGKLVRLLGRCESYNSSTNTATFTCNGSIDLICNPGDGLISGKNYELIGKVGTADNSVFVLSAIELSDNVNFDIAEKLVQYVHKVPELFY